MDELERVAFQEEIERLRHLNLLQEMRIVVLETELEQAEAASARAMMLLMGTMSTDAVSSEMDLTTPVDVH